MEECQEPVQNGGKKRSQADKVGRLKYLEQQNREVKKEIGEVKLMLRTIFAGLRDSFNFERPLLEKFACADEVDREILQLLFEAGGPGVLPKVLAAKLERFKVTRHHVSRRILRMNRRLTKQLGFAAVERRGWCWAMTSLAVDAWGKSEAA